MRKVPGTITFNLHVQIVLIVKRGALLWLFASDIFYVEYRFFVELHPLFKMS